MLTPPTQVKPLGISRATLVTWPTVTRRKHAIGTRRPTSAAKGLAGRSALHCSWRSARARRHIKTQSLDLESRARRTAAHGNMWNSVVRGPRRGLHTRSAQNACGVMGHPTSSANCFPFCSLFARSAKQVWATSTRTTTSRTLATRKCSKPSPPFRIARTPRY